MSCTPFPLSHSVQSEHTNTTTDIFLDSLWLIFSKNIIISDVRCEWMSINLLKNLPENHHLVFGVHAFFTRVQMKRLKVEVLIQLLYSNTSEINSKYDWFLYCFCASSQSLPHVRSITRDMHQCSCWEGCKRKTALKLKWQPIFKTKDIFVKV